MREDIMGAGFVGAWMSLGSVEEIALIENMTHDDVVRTAKALREYGVRLPDRPQRSAEARELVGVDHDTEEACK